MAHGAQVLIDLGDVLDTSDRAVGGSSRVTLKSSGYNPELRGRSPGGTSSRSRPSRRPGARRPAPGEVVPRRHARAAPVLRPRDLRVRRDGDQRRNALACKVLVQDVGPKVTVEPIRGLPVIKDLVVDMEPFFAGVPSVLPYLINDSDEPDRERTQSPEDRERFDDTTKCILCAACTTSCPIFWGDSATSAPRPSSTPTASSSTAGTRPARSASKILIERSGVFRCRTAFNCTDACPRGIEVTQGHRRGEARDPLQQGLTTPELGRVIDDMWSITLPSSSLLQLVPLRPTGTGAAVGGGEAAHGAGNWGDAAVGGLQQDGREPRGSTVRARSASCIDADSGKPSRPRTVSTVNRSAAASLPSGETV